MVKKIFLSLVLCFFGNLGFSQELSWTVTLNSAQLSISTAGDKQIFIEMETAIKSFLNTQRWTTDIFSEKEKIKCNLNINLLKSSGQYGYSGNAQFQVIRPVFGTTYETVIFQFIDRNIDFSFAPEDRTMLFNEQTYNNKLTSLLAYYSLIALAVDYDSFSKLGGGPFLERAYNLAILAGNTVGGAWIMGSKETRNRNWIVENLRDQQFNAFREGFYEYHRLALDDFSGNPVKARKIITDFMQTVKSTATMKPNSLIINTFFDSKNEELIKIFSESPKAEKQEMFTLISNLDPNRTELYRKILK